MTEGEATERREFYEENNIGWVARPQHNPTLKHGPKRFHRRGKFKKASNMNYALRLSVRVEDLLAKEERHSTWSQTDENTAYSHALETAIAEREGETWAEGNIRIGDYILLVDSDTRVPSDCLLEAVSEMEADPQVAILQYSSGVMNVTDNFFEKGITFFTNMIYTMIRFAVAGGDVAPFVGHNAILRWSAVQEIAYDCKVDGYEKYWSEETVSEDFDMSLRLQAEGYIVRLGSYKKDGYKEGVSLTVYDELARWEKYILSNSSTRGQVTDREQICVRLQRADFPSAQGLVDKRSRYQTLSHISRFQHAARLQDHHHGLHRHLLRHWLCLAAYPAQLLSHRLLQRLARPLLHPVVSRLLCPHLRLHHSGQLRARRPSLSHRRIRTPRRFQAKPEMDPAPDRVPGRCLPPRQPGARVPLFEHRHGVGCHDQGAHGRELLPGDEGCHDQVSMEFCVLLCRYGDHVGASVRDARGVEGGSAGGGLANVYGCGQSCVAAGGVEPAADDL